MNGYAEHDNRFPALIGAATLHLALFAALVLVPSRPAMLPIGSSVPINIVSSAPYTDTRAAVEAPQTTPAAAPQPVPQAPPQPPAPAAPIPAFSRTAAPTPKPAKPVPVQPSHHAAAQAAPSVDWNHMQQIIEAARHAGGAPTSSAAKGPPKAQTAPQARPDAGQGLSASDQLGLQQLLERLWNPNCDAPGGGALRLKVAFTVTLTGHLLGRPDAGGLEKSANPVVAAAAVRALDAVREAEPYAEPYYGQTITVNFDSKEACAKR